MLKYIIQIGIVQYEVETSAKIKYMLNLDTPFSRAFVDALKSGLPRAARIWHAEEKQWLVDPRYWDVAKEIIFASFGGVGGVDLRISNAAEAYLLQEALGKLDTSPMAEDYMMLGVRVDCPDCVLHAAWQAIEREHLDSRRAFDTGLFPLLLCNKAYNRICAQRGLQPHRSKLKPKVKPVFERRHKNDPFGPQADGSIWIDPIETGVALPEDPPPTVGQALPLPGSYPEYEPINDPVPSPTDPTKIKQEKP